MLCLKEFTHKFGLDWIYDSTAVFCYYTYNYGIVIEEFDLNKMHTTQINATGDYIGHSDEYDYFYINDNQFGLLKKDKQQVCIDLPDGFHTYFVNYFTQVGNRYFVFVQEEVQGVAIVWLFDYKEDVWKSTILDTIN